MIEDRKLSDHFTLYELTKTTVSGGFQEMNRNLSQGDVVKLEHLALLLENIRLAVDAPLVIHSGYRCPDLNAYLGSSENSQHVKCEAADFSVKGMETEVAFRLILSALRQHRFSVGQLIFEKAERSYGTAEWIHVGLGRPYREDAKTGQILTMVDGKYTLLETIKGGVNV